MVLRCFRAEMRKLRGSVVWLVFLAVPLISAIYGTFNYLQNQDVLSESWYSLFTQHTLFYSMFFFAPMVGVYAGYLWRLEHRGGNWNLMMAAPVPRFSVFAAKGLAVLALALLTQLWVFALYVLCGKAFARLPGFPPAEILSWFLRGACGALPVIELQLLLSMVIRSFAAPVLLALGGGVAGMLLCSRDKGLIWPYALMLLGMNANKSENVLAGGLGGYLIACAGSTLLFGLLAGALLRWRDVRA